MGRRFNQHIVLGGRLLPASASEGQLVSGRREGVGVQVDTDPLPLLADRNTVRRERLPQRPEEAWFLTPQEPRTSGVTRSGRRLRRWFRVRGLPRFEVMSRVVHGRPAGRLTTMTLAGGGQLARRGA